MCPIHNVPLEIRTSRSKFAEDGTPKTYKAHGFGDDMCFGTPTKTPGESRTLSTLAEEMGVKGKERNPMLACNAMNNACAIFATTYGQTGWDKSEVESIYLDILGILETT